MLKCLRLYFIYLILSAAILSCKKLVTVDPPLTSLTGENIYTNDATATSVLTGMYTSMSSASLSACDLPSLGFITGLTGDELTLYSGMQDYRLLSYYQNHISPVDLSNFWITLYNRLYSINSAIEKTSHPNGLTEKIRAQILGEAKFMRAFHYLTLVSLYGDIPLVTSSNYLDNSTLSRASSNKIWTLITSDLIDAQNLLSSDFLDGSLVNKTTERLRPTKWAATALLARAYLYQKDWKNAEIQATEIINKTDKFQLTSLDQVFKKNSTEAIWQLQPVLQGRNTEDARSYVITSNLGPNGAMGVYLSNQLLNSFEPGDNRKKNWVDTVTYEGVIYSFAFKYKEYLFGEPVSEYNTVLRLGEQYLIRAEARINQNNIEGAKGDLGTIRSRAGLNNTTATTVKDLLIAIFHERQVELFTEWGHRWFDMKRLYQIDQVMSLVSPTKGSSWNSNWQLFPVPLIDIQTDANILQNPGY